MHEELIRWIPASTAPDDSITVLVLLPPAADEPSWLGWFDSSKNEWREVNGSILRHRPTHWADMPQGAR